jgi:hypothetical protein
LPCGEKGYLAEFDMHCFSTLHNHHLPSIASKIIGG